MAVWKYLILVGGIAGLVGFFLPLADYRSPDGKVTRSISSFEIVRGIDDSTAIIEEAQRVGASPDDMQKISKFINDELDTYRGVIVALFAPAAALALLGAICGIRRRAGRFAGLLSLALGVVNAGIFSLFHKAAEQDRDGTASLGIGVWLLLVAGIAGIIAGLGAIFAPDRGGPPVQDEAV